jgi:hypothetical protein
MRFLLGTHQPGWLADPRRPDLFVSDRRLRGYQHLPRASRAWACDSGAFSILAAGRAFDPPAVYAARIRRYRDEIGHLAWAAGQDWMCEPFILARTGLDIGEHQRRTVANFLTLRRIAPDLPIIPVLQGFQVRDYLHCVSLYARHGVDLAAQPLVGLGSVCRRQATADTEQIITALHETGVTRLHGFGVKTLGLRRYGHLLASADSMAWSYAARRAGHPLPGCTTHRNCANCRRYAYPWHTAVTTAVTAHPAHHQPALFTLDATA